METWRAVRKIFKKFWSKGGYEGWPWSQKDGTEGFKNVNLKTDNGVRPSSFKIILWDVVLRQPRISLAVAV